MDLAESFDEMSVKEIMLRFKLLDKDLAADTFAEMDKDKKREIIERFSDDDVEELITELDEDELVDTLQELPANMVRCVMDEFIVGDRRKVINRLLGYPKDSVGSIMTVEFLSAKAGSSSESVLKRVIAYNKCKPIIRSFKEKDYLALTGDELASLRDTFDGKIEGDIPCIDLNKDPRMFFQFEKNKKTREA